MKDNAQVLHVRMIKVAMLRKYLCQLLYSTNLKQPMPINNLMGDVVEMCGGSRQLTQEKYNESSDPSPRCISTVYFAITGKYRYRVTHKFRVPYYSVVGLFKYDIPVLVIVFFRKTSLEWTYRRHPSLV